VRRQLGSELGRAMARAGLTNRAIALKLRNRKGEPINHSTVSRMRNGIGPPPDQRILEQWLDAVDADTDTRERVRALAEAAYTETTRWSDLLSHAGGNLQAQVAEREQDSTVVENFQQTIIPGLAQTSAYTRAVLHLVDQPELDVEATIAGRLQRQQILYDPGRVFRFLIAEAVLRRSPAPGVMTGQLDRLTQIAGLETVELAVLPDTVMVALPHNNFALHTRPDGGEFVSMELVHGREQVHDTGGVGRYRALWDRLWEASARGDDALELIRLNAGR